MKSKAWVLREPDFLEMDEFEIVLPSEGQILVKMAVTSVCASDPKMVHGLTPFKVYPIILGHELSGEVAEMGPGAAQAYGLVPRRPDHHRTHPALRPVRVVPLRGQLPQVPPPEGLRRNHVLRRSAPPLRRLFRIHVSGAGVVGLSSGSGHALPGGQPVHGHRQRGPLDQPPGPAQARRKRGGERRRLPGSGHGHRRPGGRGRPGRRAGPGTGRTPF